MQGMPDSQLAIQLMQQAQQQAQPPPPGGNPAAGWNPQLGPMIGRMTDGVSAPSAAQGPALQPPSPSAPPPAPVTKAAALDAKLASLLPAFSRFERTCKQALVPPSDIIQPQATAQDPQAMALQMPVLQPDGLPQPGAAPPPMAGPQVGLQPQPDGQMQGFTNPMPGAPNPLGAGTLAYGGMRAPGMGKQAEEPSGWPSLVEARNRLLMTAPGRGTVIGALAGGMRAPQGYGLQGLLRGGVAGTGLGLGFGLGGLAGDAAADAMGVQSSGDRLLGTLAGAVPGALAGHALMDYAMGPPAWEQAEGHERRPKHASSFVDKREKAAYGRIPGRMINPSENMRRLGAIPAAPTGGSSVVNGTRYSSPAVANQVNKNLTATRKAVAGMPAASAAYTPGQASFASAGYSGYGGSPKGTPTASFSAGDFARNPGLGTPPRVAQLGQSAMQQGMASATAARSGIYAPDRMAARVKSLQAPMTMPDKQQVDLLYRNRAYQPKPAPGLNSGNAYSRSLASGLRMNGGGMTQFGQFRPQPAPRAGNVGSLAQGTQPFRPGSTPDSEWSKLGEAPVLSPSASRALPHEGIFNGRKLRIQRGPTTQANGKFSEMGRQKAASILREDVDRLMQLAAKSGFVAAGAIPGAVVGGMAGDEIGQSINDSADLGIGLTPGIGGALAGGAAGGLLGSSLYDSLDGDREKRSTMHFNRDPFRKPLTTDRIIRSLARQYGFLSRIHKSDGKPERKYTLTECQALCDNDSLDRDDAPEEGEKEAKVVRRARSLGRETRPTESSPARFLEPRRKGGSRFFASTEQPTPDFDDSPATPSPGQEAPRGPLARLR